MQESHLVRTRCCGNGSRFVPRMLTWELGHRTGGGGLGRPTLSSGVGSGCCRLLLLDLKPFRRVSSSLAMAREGQGHFPGPLDLAWAPQQSHHDPWSCRFITSGPTGHPGTSPVRPRGGSAGQEQVVLSVTRGAGGQKPSPTSWLAKFQMRRAEGSLTGTRGEENPSGQPWSGDSRTPEELTCVMSWAGFMPGMPPRAG